MTLTVSFAGAGGRDGGHNSAGRAARPRVHALPQHASSRREGIHLEEARCRVMRTPLAAQRGSLSIREICSLGNAPRMKVMQCHALYSRIPAPTEMRGLSAGGPLLCCAALTCPVALCAGG